MFNLFADKYLSKAFQAKPEVIEEAEAENEAFNLRKEKRRGQGYLRMHHRLAKKGAVWKRLKTASALM